MSALPAERLSPAPVLVCGLGSLGQACLQRLLAFDLPLHGVDLRAWPTCSARPVPSELVPFCC